MFLKWAIFINVTLMVVSAIFFVGIMVERIRPDQCMKWMNERPAQDVLKERCEFIEHVDSVYLFRCDKQFVMVQSI